MILDPRTAHETAEKLMQIKAIKLQPKAPFTWASGWKSPIYCDNRITLSYPDLRNFLKTALADALKKLYPDAEVIAGVATGAIAMGALVADELGLPFVYVRPEPKKHGRQNQIEGELPANSKVVVVEDLISTGGSSLKVVDVLRESGAEVMGMLALFTYAFRLAEENFDKAQLALHTLSDYPHLLEALQQSGDLDKETFETLISWREDPSSWQA
ncbi:orotate phosphoribosyltransferase [Croceimicrobium hydrocarbonivorans]|uniref:Orotate phosphoribosyltransferase n=1 Tax=Croceimicrobium hydrocarbonivorans TaxID=2761580 RepID=A0A7H0VGT5_9FLAO|nr:orotate phosphoribosyltransferase [Croceimicrobium hydrocarbonivorans]QNR24933.1 orotate phosphoribosyltransferase [Croceimicrobium hydrocarbonivorans]